MAFPPQQSLGSPRQNRMTQEFNFFEETVQSVSHKTPSRKDEIKRIIEALLCSSSEPIAIEKLKAIIQTSYPIHIQEIRKLLTELQKTYQKHRRGFQIDEIAGGFILRTVKEMFPYIEMLHRDRRGEKLSKAATEALAVIAYKQPITRIEIEGIRGVDSSGTLSSLMERKLIEVVGRLDSPGRPVQYGTTKRFLQHFGLKNIKDLSTLFESAL